MVDTTGAGDTFNGALAAELAGGAALRDAAELRDRRRRVARRRAPAPAAACRARRGRRGARLSGPPAPIARRRAGGRRAGSPRGRAGSSRAGSSSARVELALPHWPRVARRPRGRRDVRPARRRPARGAATRSRRAVDALERAESPDLAPAARRLSATRSPMFGGRLAPEAVAAELAALPRAARHDRRARQPRLARSGTACGAALERRGDHRAREPGGPAGRARRASLGRRARRPPPPPRRIPRAALRGRARPASRCWCSPTTPTLFPHVPARVALTLSGHTHGGQVAIPLLRRPRSPPTTASATPAATSSRTAASCSSRAGLGTSGLPVRLLAPPEVAVLTLRPAG